VDCCFVVVDNDGGGIFSFLPQSELPEQQFERFWGTQHGIDLTALAAVHGVSAVAVKKASSVAPAVHRALVEGGVQVVVVKTDRAANVAVHGELVDAVAAALDRA
jgi:2-succinyl-5-enolpyruvyl-6-hydroxy-3-cyclohexene-1-carboxylate synthase